VRIVNHDEYEKNQKFIVELGEPRHITSDKPSASIAHTYYTALDRIISNFGIF